MSTNIDLAKLQTLDEWQLAGILYTALSRKNPHSDLSFLYSLNKKELLWVFDLVNSRSAGEKEKKWGELYAKINRASLLANSILREHSLSHLKEKEHKMLTQDQEDISRLEQQF